MVRRRFLGCVLPLVVVSLLLCGCGSGSKKARPARPQGTLGGSGEVVPSIALQGTIGSVAYLQGIRLMRVRGYGLVVGLEGTGSAQCPTSIRKSIIREIRRYKQANPRIENLPSPESMINSMDTAVVEVVGEVPAGAPKGTIFDLHVSAVDPDVQSLWGGYLLGCELRIFREVAPARRLEGRVHAKAMGQIFINPFRDDKAGGDAELMSGTIIGGGINVETRLLRLICTVESYAMVQRVAEAINRRFTFGDDKVADAVSPTNIELSVPDAYRNDVKRFIDIVTHLPLSPSIAEREARAKLLSEELLRTDVPFEEVALSLEGVGKLAIPFLQELYANPRKEVSFYAARTGMRLDHELAVDALIEHAKDTKNVYQRRAIRALGECEGHQRAAYALRALLNSGDPRIRIEAYEALRLVDPSSLARVYVGDLPVNFVLEVVPSQSDGLIYATRTHSRRLALIGGDDLICKPPVFYAQAASGLTITAEPDDNMLKVLQRANNLRGQRRTLGPYRVPRTVMSLVQFLGNSARRGSKGQLQGLGIDYAEILDVLNALCDSGAVDADVRWQEPDVEELVGPVRPMGRPESEL